MNLEECINRKGFCNEVNEFTLVHNGENYSFKIGDRINRLTIVKLGYLVQGISKPYLVKGFIARCDCGNYIGPNRLLSLVNGDSMSCGCYQRELHSRQIAERNFKHGNASRASRDKLYIIWAAMKDRVLNHNRPDSKWYSDKGIELYPEWNSFIAFKEWAISSGYEEGLSIDRINNSLGYNPDNCRWIPLKDQNKNKTNNNRITLNGETKILADWCRQYNVSDKSISAKLKKGLSYYDIFNIENHELTTHDK